MIYRRCDARRPSPPPARRRRRPAVLPSFDDALASVASTSTHRRCRRSCCRQPADRPTTPANCNCKTNRHHLPGAERNEHRPTSRRQRPRVRVRVNIIDKMNRDRYSIIVFLFKRQVNQLTTVRQNRAISPNITYQQQQDNQRCYAGGTTQINITSNASLSVGRFRRPPQARWQVQPLPSGPGSIIATRQAKVKQARPPFTHRPPSNAISSFRPQAGCGRRREIRLHSADPSAALPVRIPSRTTTRGSCATHQRTTDDEDLARRHPTPAFPARAACVRQASCRFC